MKSMVLVYVLTAILGGLLNAAVFTIGTADGYNSSTGYPSPYANADVVDHEQYLVTAAELTAAGASGGNINSLSFHVAGVNGCAALSRYTMKIGTTAMTQLTDYVPNDDLTTVFYSNPYQPVVGWNEHAFSSPWTWDGVSNLVVDVGYRIMSTTSANASVWYDDISPYYRTLYLVGMSSTQSTLRPVMRIELSDVSVQIGSGSYHAPVPVAPDYVYGYSQSLYLQSEINVPGLQITRVAFEWDGAAACPNSQAWTVYLGHTTRTVFASNGDWVPLGELTQVFSGNVSLPATPGWVELILATPFAYDNARNLVIAVDENGPGQDVPWGLFLCTQTSVMAKRSIHYYHDTINPDPAAPPTSTGNFLAYPNVRLTFQPAVVGPPQAPILTYPADQATGLPVGGFDLAWAPDAAGGAPDSYTLYLSSSADGIFDQYSWPNLTATQFNAATQGGVNFAYSQTWYWTVKAVNASGNAVANPRSFEIEPDPALVIPCCESFDGANWPEGWTQDHSYGMSGDIWWPQYSNNAGGEPYEMHAADVDEFGGTRLISPPILSSGLSALLVSFKHFFADSGPGLTAKLQYSHNLSVWTDTGWSLASGNGDAGGTVTVLIPGLSAPYTYVGWTLEGDHYMMNGWYLDDVCFSLPLAHDVAVVAITQVPEVVSPDALFASATIANYGTNTESFEVFMRSGARFTDTQTVTNLAPGAFIDVYFAPFLPALGLINEIEIVTLLASDQNEQNDAQTQLFACVELMVEGLLNVQYDLTALPDGPASFTLARPDLLTPLSNPPAEDVYISASEWINGAWYALGYDYGDPDHDKLWRIDALTGDMTLLGQTGASQLTGLTQNPNTGVIYACNGTQLYTVNPATGAASVVGPFNIGDYMVCLAFDQSHNTLYGISGWDPALYTINPVTGAATLVGSLGLENIEPLDCAFDQDNGKLFMTGWFNQSFLYWVDTATGQAWKVGDFPQGTTPSGFAIPFGPPEAPVAVIQNGGTIAWNAVYGAQNYRIYGAPAPEGPFTLLGSSPATSWTDPAFPGARRFYRVTAVKQE